MIKTFPITAKAKTSSIKQPKEVCNFSRDESGNYHYEEEEVQKQLSYYYFPDSFIERKYDLKQGYSKFKKIPEEENVGDFKALLKAVTKHEQSLGAKIDSNIITFRGILTKLLTLPQLKEEMSLKVISYDGHIMIKNDDEFELNKRNKSSPNDYAKQCEYSGYKFEKVVMLDNPWSACSRQQIENRDKATVNNYEQYMSVVKTSIDKVKLLLAGEVDGIFDYYDEINNLSHYIELKTNKLIENENQFKNFETKLFKTWAQTFLIGIKKIGFGFRDNNLLLRNIELFETDEIPILLKNKINCLQSLKFFGSLINWLYTEIDTSVEGSYKLTFENDNVVLMTLNDVDQVKHEFLSDDFITWRNHLRNA